MIDGQTENLAALVRRLVSELRRTTPDGPLIEQALNYLKRHGLEGSIMRAQAMDESLSGLERAARWVETRRDSYDAEHGTTDPETGTREYPGDGNDYVFELTEIAEGIRAMKGTS